MSLIAPPPLARIDEGFQPDLRQHARLARRDVAVELADAALRQVPALDLARDRQRRDLGDQPPVPADNPLQTAPRGPAGSGRVSLPSPCPAAKTSDRSRGVAGFEKPRLDGGQQARPARRCRRNPDVVSVSPSLTSAAASAAETILLRIAKCYAAARPPSTAMAITGGALGLVQPLEPCWPCEPPNDHNLHRSRRGQKRQVQIRRGT